MHSLISFSEPNHPWAALDSLYHPDSRCESTIVAPKATERNSRSNRVCSESIIRSSSLRTTQPELRSSQHSRQGGHRQTSKIALCFECQQLRASARFIHSSGISSLTVFVAIMVLLISIHKCTTTISPEDVPFIFVIIFAHMPGWSVSSFQC